MSTLFIIIIIIII